MELLGLVQQGFQKVAECVASYRVGQMMLRHMDRALWVLEKSARWAVPPPLDQDERPSHELLRPLPWFPFLILLTVLRLIRESVSIFNLVIGKPPLHSADVVMFLQSKRRYLRALKYQGSRTIRARRTETTQGSWLSRLTSLFEFTMCFRQRPKEDHPGSPNNEEVLVVRRKQAKKEDAGDDSNVDRLIERMLVDLNTDSDDDSSYTLTNVTGVKSCSGSDPDSENESTLTGGALNTSQDSVPSSTPSSSTTHQIESKPSNDVTIQNTELTPENSSTPVKEPPRNEIEPSVDVDDLTPEATVPEATSAERELSPSKSEVTHAKPESSVIQSETVPVETETVANDSETASSETHTSASRSPPKSEVKPKLDSPTENADSSAISCAEKEERLMNVGGKTGASNSSPKSETDKFMINERAPQRKSPKKTQKLANGKAFLCSPSGKKGMNERRDSDVPVVRVTPAEDSDPEDEDYARQPHHNNH